MSYQIRCFIKKEICKYADIPEKIFMSHMCLERNTKKGFSFELPLKTNFYNIEKYVKNIIQQKFDGALKNIRVKKKDNHDMLSIDVDKHFFIKEILQTNLSKISAPLVSCNREKIVVEFSSPNIAKPFHVGHLRSTIIGNFTANMNEFFNNSVVKLNYLGDWGTQIGLVILGMNLVGMSNESIKNNSIEELYNAYVYANKLAETDHEILDQARKIFQQLENGDGMYFSQWQSLKKYTVNELDETYNRIGIKFDEYNWESSYNSSNIHHILKLMGDLGILTGDSKGRKAVSLNNNKLVPIIKSDGSTLYIVRDIAAAIDRAEKYNFDKMYYVADSSQRDHFRSLKNILTKLNMAWASQIHHLPFGKIIGMSTRKGTAVFLNNFLDEANAIIKQKQHQLNTTKVDKNENSQSTDILGISAIIINDLKQRRLRDYAFNWDTALDMKGETGIKLQYTHCRLANLKENCGATVANQCDPTLLEESIIDELIMSIAQFDEAVIASYQTLEACYLVKYLFNLSHTVNRTLERLRVKGEPMDIASQRLLLFQVAKNVLNTGMKLLGLMPLNKM